MAIQLNPADKSSTTLTPYQASSQNTPADEKTKEYFKTHPPVAAEPYDGEIKIKPFDILPHELIQLIMYHLIDMEAYDPWTLACVSKDLKTIAEDSRILNYFLKRLSRTMKVSPVALERALRKIKLPDNFSNNRDIKLPLFHDEQIVKLRLFQWAQMKKIVSTNLLFSKRQSSIPLQEMLKPATSCFDPLLKKKLAQPSLLKTLLKNIKQNDLLSALLTLDSMEQLTASDSKKILEILRDHKNRRIFQILHEVVEKILQQKETMTPQDLRDISKTLLEIDIAEAERMAHSISEDYAKSSALQNVSEAFLKNVSEASFEVALWKNVEALALKTVAELAEAFLADENITNAEKSSLSLLRVVKDFLQTHNIAYNITNAERVAHIIPKNANKSLVLEKVSEAYLKARNIVDNIAKAERAANAIPFDEIKSRALEQISEAYLKAPTTADAKRAENIAHAERAANAIPDNAIKSSAFQKIAIKELFEAFLEAKKTGALQILNASLKGYNIVSEERPEDAFKPSAPQKVALKKLLEAFSEVQRNGAKNPK